MKSCGWGDSRRFPLASLGPHAACGRFRWRWLLVGLGVVLASCVAGLPLPVTTLQFIDGSWPAKQERAGESRPYIIKGDRLEFPDIEFGVSRPNQAEWEFRVGDDVINLLRRTPLREGGVIPRVIIQIVPRPPDFAFGAYLEQELRERGGESGAILLEKGVVDRTEAHIWTLDLPADSQNQTERVRRYYLFKPATITLIDCRAALDDFATMLPDFGWIVNQVTLPADADAAPQPTTNPKLVETERLLVLPAVDVSLQLPRPNWDFLVNQATLNVFFNAPLDADEVTPNWTVTVVDTGNGFDLNVYEEALRKELAQGAVEPPATESLLIDGLPGTRYTVRREDANSKQQVVNQVWVCPQATRVVVLQFVANSKRFDALVGDRQRLIDSLRFSKVSP